MWIVDSLGRLVLSKLRYWSALFDVFYGAFKAVWIERGRGRWLIRSTLRKQVLFTGLQAIPLISVVGATVGLWLGAMAYAQAESVAQYYTPVTLGLLNQLSTASLAPLLVALIIIARSGTAIATELGNMQLNREIDALHAMGVNVDYFVVFPRVIAMFLSLLCLTIYFATCVVATELLLLFALGVRMPTQQVLDITLSSGLSLSALGQAGLKAGILGLGIAVYCCHHGLSTTRSFTEVPRSATRAVVGSILFCFVVNAGLTALFFVIAPLLITR